MNIIANSIRRVHHLCRLAAITSKTKGDKIKIQGWVQIIRKMKKNLFVDVNDGSSSQNIQVVLQKNLLKEDINVGDSLEVSGIIGISPQGQKELQAEDVKIIGTCNIIEGYPFTPKQVHPPEYVREHLHLRPRVGYMASIFRIRHRATKLIHDFMDEKNFINIHTPIITCNDCEGAGEVFKVQPDNAKLLKEMSKPDTPLENSYFDKKVFLSVSGQLSLEAMSHGLGNTYTFSPAFRAENCKSPLHLSEFYMIEAELAFLDELSDLTRFIEEFIKSVSQKLLQECEGDFINCLPNRDDTVKDYSWLNKAWKSVTYEEAINVLKQHKNDFNTEFRPQEGLSKEQELFLVKHFGVPIFVTDWPKSIKPFYMKANEKDTSKVHAVDLLMPTVGELIGGGLRENNYNRLKENTPSDLDWYLELRKFGGISTGGFGLGFERFLQLLTGMKNIRDVIPFPRYPHNCQM